MGNYNCQECITKEVNVINELLLDNSLFGSDSVDKNNPNNSNVKANKDELKKAIEKANLSLEQKKYYKKLINENHEEILNKIKLNNNINKNEQNNNNIIEINIKEVEPSLKDQLNSEDEEQKKIIQVQQEQISEQQKLIEQYKQNELLLGQEQNQLNTEEEDLKNKLNESQNKENEQNIQGIIIQTLEPPNRENQQYEEDGQIVIKNIPTSGNNDYMQQIENVDNNVQNNEISQEQEI